MSVFIVTATHTDDDYKRPHVSSETAMATSREDAVVRAVEFYLDRLDDGYAFDFHSPSGFNKVIEQHRNRTHRLYSQHFTITSRATQKECLLVSLSQKPYL